jgi:alpha-2-macroglobulin
MDENKPLPIPPQEPAALKTSSLWQLYGKYVIALAVVLVLIGGYYLVPKKHNDHADSAADVPDFLNIVSVSPSGGYDHSVYSKIQITFNMPVHADQVAGYIEFTPNVEGKFVQGPTHADVVFEPNNPLPAATQVAVRLKFGLTSVAGKKLAQDYVFSFTTRIQEDSIALTANGLSGRFMSFDASIGVDLNIAVGSEIKKPRLKIYKGVTLPMLLDSLTYTPDNSSYSPYTLYGGYSEKAVDTSKLEVVKDLNDIKEGQTFHFAEPVGLYLVQSFDGEKVIGTSWVTMNTTGIHMRQDDQKVYLAAQQLSGGAPASDIGVTFYSLGKKPTVIAEHSLSGIDQYAYEYPRVVDLIVGQKGAELMIIPINLPNTRAQVSVYANLNSQQQIAIYTDRPIYKPGDKVYFRGIVRTDNDALYQKAGVTKVRIVQNDNLTKTEVIVPVKDDGTFSGEIVASPTDSYPEYVDYAYLYVTDKLTGDDYYSRGNTYYEISEYKKPEYDLKVTIPQADYTRGDTIPVMISGAKFNGQVLANEKVTFAVYQRSYFETEQAVYNSSFNLNGMGGMCGGGVGFEEDYYGEAVQEGREVTLDRNGRATVDFRTTELESGFSQQLTFVMKRQSSSGDVSAAGTTVMHSGDFNLFFRPSQVTPRGNDAYTWVVYGERRGGDKLADTDLTYTMSNVTYDNGERKQQFREGRVKTDSNGVATIKEQLGDEQKGKTVYFNIRGRDSRGNDVENSDYLYVQELQDYSQNAFYYGGNTVLKIVSMVNTLQPGAKASLSIESPSDMWVFTTFERGRVYGPQWLELKHGTNTFTFDVPDTYVPSITPTFSFFYNGTFHIEGLSLNVPAMKKVVNVDIIPDKTRYKPGETATLTIKTRDSTGTPISAALGISVVDKAIFALRKSATPALHSSFYYFRDRSTNSSSSLTWITSDCGCGGGGGGGGDSGALNRDVDTLYWNPNLKTGADGTAVVSVKLGNSETTWRVLGYASTASTQLGQGQIDFLVAK